jgi:glycosyltransferase involved in cell wall biosynthesis
MPALLFDARLVLNKPTGIGQYIASLLPPLLDLAPDWRVHLVRSPQAWPEYGLSILAAPNLSQHLSTLPHMHPVQNLWAPRLARRLGVDLLHYPHFDAPVLWQTVPVVATIYDAKYLVRPDFFPRMSGVKRLYMRFCFAQTLRRAAAVITTSAHTADDLVRLFGVPRERLKVIYLAANDRFGRVPEAAQAELRQRYGLARPFLLCVGERRPHKNQVGLIRAYAASQSRQSHDLVIIGRSYQDYDEPERTVQELGLAGQVHLLNNIGDADLAGFYSAADLFVLVSFYEGFGLPLLEAMACGAAVITAAPTTAGEIVGDAGLAVDPDEPGAITAAIDQVLLQPALRAHLIQRGQERLQQFTWTQAAQQTLAVYEQVLAGRRG